MSPDQPGTAPEDPVPFACTRSLDGMDAAWVRVAGELNAATVAVVEQMLDVTCAEARVIVLDLRDVTSLDRAAVPRIASADRRIRAAGARLVVTPAGEQMSTALRAASEMGLELLETTAVRAAPSAAASASPLWPLDNQVNARVLSARVMAVPDERLWLQESTDAIFRVWVPRDARGQLPAGAEVEMYLDHYGQVNGWRAPAADLSINQRLLGPGEHRAEGAPMVCQGRCGVVWLAPAADAFAEHDEHCLTCAGPLAPA